VIASTPSGAGFVWDDSLYRGSAAYYAAGRVPYPAELASAICAELSPAGRGRLLDCGCGPGSLTLLLAPLFAEAIGIDADAAMIEQAIEAGRRARAGNISWRQLRSEELPAGLGRFDLVTFAQSFHWVDQPVVAGLLRQLLEPGGSCVLVYANTHEGAPGSDDLEYPRPPRPRIAELVAAYLGPVRRAGGGTLPAGLPSGGGAALRAAGFTTAAQRDVGAGTVRVRTEDDVVASVFSLSSAAPHLFGAQLGRFEADLRRLLRDASPSGVFAERMQGATIEVWRPAGG
jgi:SAM-dependent methyltransferase